MKFLAKLVSCWAPAKHNVAPEAPVPQSVEVEDVVKTFAVTDDRLTGKQSGKNWRPSLCEISEDMVVSAVPAKKPKRVMNTGKLTVETKPRARTQSPGNSPSPRRAQSYNYDQSPTYSPSPRRSPNHVFMPGFAPTGFFF